MGGTYSGGRGGVKDDRLPWRRRGLGKEAGRKVWDAIWCKGWEFGEGGASAEGVVRKWAGLEEGAWCDLRAEPSLGNGVRAPAQPQGRGCALQRPGAELWARSQRHLKAGGHSL
ncbi:hypothetical protein chiPu_0023741 [Chiloscyllium punctatum]|uniref:Uncharacterized protein n=1 Tax=Chiloscyllium punctatum TaxID=137246 RepID=A0A401TBF0_CHIPU|nr:hypothetical protein [Chiloscyllium punctatum]